ncbi:anion permease [Shigella flexneri]
MALLPVPAGLENHTWLYFAVFTGVIVRLILEPVPGAVVAMVGISIIAISLPAAVQPRTARPARF